MAYMSGTLAEIRLIKAWGLGVIGNAPDWQSGVKGLSPLDSTTITALRDFEPLVKT